jgi:hypothetical protein
MSPVPSQNFGGGLDDPGTQTESSIERGFRSPGSPPESIPESIPGSMKDEWGHSESLDPENVGDIADEGHGHRG